MGALRRAAPVPSARPFLKRPRQQVVDTATCGTAAREKPSRHAAGAGEEFPVRDPKRAKVTCNGVGVESVDAALGVGILRKRMAAELDAVRALLRKAELLSGGKKNGRSMAAAKQRSEAPVEEASAVKPPPAKRAEASAAALAKTSKLESMDLRLPDDKEEFVDICGGVSPVAIQSVSPIVSIEKKAVNSGNSSSSSSDSRSPSSSDDSDSDSSDSDEAVNIPVQLPPAVSTAVLIAKAKVRRTQLEMERAVMPDESILPRDLKDLCILEYGRASIMQRLGLFLKADA